MRNIIVYMYQSGKCYKATSQALGLQLNMIRIIIHKLRKLGTDLIQEVIKEPRTTSKERQASLASVKVSVHDSTIRKRLGKNGIHGRVPRQKPQLTKKNTKAHLTFANNVEQKFNFLKFKVLTLCAYR